MKTCARCLTSKQETAFHYRNRARGTRQSHCIQCGLDKLAEFRKIHPPKKGGPKRTLTDAERYERRLESRKKTYRKNKEKVLATAAAYRARNTEREKAARRDWYLRNKEHVAKTTKEYRLARPEMYAAAFAKRRASKRNAIPPWIDHDKIAAIYDEARRRTAETGVPHEVDHVHPLQGRTICGLHVAENLRVIPRSDNRSKSNGFDP